MLIRSIEVSNFEQEIFLNFADLLVGALVQVLCTNSLQFQYSILDQTLHVGRWGIRFPVNGFCCFVLGHHSFAHVLLDRVLLNVLSVFVDCLKSFRSHECLVQSLLNDLVFSGKGPF